MSKKADRKGGLVLQYVLLGVLALFCWLLQSAPGGFAVIAGCSPVLLPVLTAAVGVYYEERTGAVFGLLCGILMDIYTVPSVGFHAVLLTAVGVACGFAVKHFFTHSLWAALVLCLGAALTYFVLYWLLFKCILGGGGAWYYLVRFSLPAALYSGAFGLVFCPLVRWLHRRLSFA